MINKTIISEEDDSCLEFKKVADYYLITILGFIGFVLNLLCSIAFYKSKIYKTSDSIMFKYYFIKIILDTIIFFLRCFNPIFETDSDLVETSYFIRALSVVVDNYFRNALLLTSEIMHIAADTNCLLKLINVQKIRFKYTFILVVVSAFLYSFLYYIYRCFSYDVVMLVTKDQMNNTMTLYRPFKSKFGKSTTYANLELVHTIQRDFLYVFLLFLINLLILIRLKKNFKLKKLLISSSNHHSDNSKLDKTEKNIAIMVIVIGITQSIGHLPNFLIKLKLFNLDNNECFVSFYHVMLYISLLSFPIVLYIFNHVIRKNFNLIVKTIFKMNKQSTAKVSSLLS